MSKPLQQYIVRALRAACQTLLDEMISSHRVKPERPTFSYGGIRAYQDKEIEQTLGLISDPISQPQFDPNSCPFHSPYSRLPVEGYRMKWYAPMNISHFRRTYQELTEERHKICTRRVSQGMVERRETYRSDSEGPGCTPLDQDTHQSVMIACR